MSLIAGIDVNSNVVDVTLLDEDTCEAQWLRYRIDDGRSDLDAFDRARRLRDAMPARTTWRDAGVVVIGIEKPMSQSFKSMSAQTRVQGALLACLPLDIRMYELVPASWKKLAVGHGHASKQDVATWARRVYVWDDSRGFIAQDAYDAAGIGRAAQLKDAAERGAAAA